MVQSCEVTDSRTTAIGVLVIKEDGNPGLPSRLRLPETQTWLRDPT